MRDRRVFHCSRFFYPDSSNGAAAANRALMECLSRRGFAVEALCGTAVDTGFGNNPASVMADLGLKFEISGGDKLMVGAFGDRNAPAKLLSAVHGVPLTISQRATHRYGHPDQDENADFLALTEEVFNRFRPDVLVTYGGDELTFEILRRARRRGIATVFTLHNFGYPELAPFVDVDTILVASRFSARHHREVLGVECDVLPYLIDLDRSQAVAREPLYVTFINPSPEKGVYAFARIADELGCLRPEIPFLVVESRGTEETLVKCGLDLRARGNVFLMAQTPNPRDFWGVTRVCLIPSLWWENQPLVAIEAMVNGIPVVGSDRGGIPETLGGSGVVLPLPDRMTASSRLLPTADEVAPWVEAIIRLWDDADWYGQLSRRAISEASRWSPEVVEPLYVQFFEEVGRSRGQK
jgi:glycosyltransferase involved in cell wall biosynthesis